MSYKDKIEQILSQKRIKADRIKDLEKFLDQFESDKEIDIWLRNKWNTSNNLIDENLKNKKLTVIKRAVVKIVSMAAIIAGILFLINYGEGNHSKNNRIAEVEIPNEFREVILQRDQQVYNLSDSSININENLVCMQGNDKNLKMSSVRVDTLKQQTWSTLKVPIGKDYYVELSDGTKVWLNACSEFKFPDYFRKGKRVVELNGEAYFEVQSDVTNPFFVKTGDSQVIVTGTKFNVYHYLSEVENAVTLVEGKVTVETSKNKFILKPGEQFLNNNNNVAKIVEVDADKFTSWKDGMFEFNNLSLKEISLRIEKWYNIKFDFEDINISGHRFTGMIKKDKSIDYFITVLQKTTNLKFEIKENIVIVKN
ncbi:FecR family protein [Plebeiibacterium sediminum]|uniref:DUF4974 domain-containing protein n=1 Tax=Plebeiibacterium sediminum TaxID=2992112 RepID=A0AAE3M516_9BACT|nr:FecR family protein [Plebeiobacterium sediminum]MCW3786790.1 DUF4974 domain-containing protein [Plebeiobacterium sediminum]